MEDDYHINLKCIFPPVDWEAVSPPLLIVCLAVPWFQDWRIMKAWIGYMVLNVVWYWSIPWICTFSPMWISSFSYNCDLTADVEILVTTWRQKWNWMFLRISMHLKSLIFTKVILLSQNRSNEEIWNASNINANCSNFLTPYHCYYTLISQVGGM